MCKIQAKPFVNIYCVDNVSRWTDGRTDGAQLKVPRKKQAKVMTDWMYRYISYHTWINGLKVMFQYCYERDSCHHGNTNHL